MKRKLYRAFVLVAVLLVGLQPTPTPADQPGRIRLDLLGRYDGGIYSPLAVQNPPAWDAGRKRLDVGSQVRKRVDVLDLASLSAPALVDTIEISDLPPGIPIPGKIGGGISALAFREDVLAVAFAAADKGDTGIVVFFDPAGKALAGPVDVGFSPNAMSFVPGKPLLLVVNQADPGATVDPPASLSVIRLDRAGGQLSPAVSTITFTQFDGHEAELRAAGIRLITPGSSASEQLEPESLAVSEDGRTAWITLPRNNAIGVIDLEAMQVRTLLPLGSKDMSRLGNGFDASDRDGRIAIRA